MNQFITVGLILLALVGWGTWEHTRFLSVKAEYSDFRQEATAQVLKQEKAHNDQINSAMAERDVSIARLRDSEARSRSLRASITPQSGDRLCFHRTAFDAALQQFLGDIEGLLAEGDISMINLQATLAAWPK